MVRTFFNKVFFLFVCSFDYFLFNPANCRIRGYKKSLKALCFYVLAMLAQGERIFLYGTAL